jgi:hypothetical protein
MIASNESTLAEIQALTASGITLHEVANLVQKKVGLGPELIEYIAKTTIYRLSRMSPALTPPPLFLFTARLLVALFHSRVCQLRKAMVRPNSNIF